MAHELEFINGTASYAGREPAWHQLGTVIEDLTYDEAGQKANLFDWNVRAEPFTALLGEEPDVNMPLREHITVPAPDHQIIVRDNPASGKTESLGVVGGRYEPVQNEEAFAVVPFLEDLGATVETAGSIRGGRQVFVSMDLNGGFVIDPDGAGDRVQGYGLFRTSHDGSLAVEACSSWVRVVCANTFDFALGGNSKRAYKVRHTATAQDRLAQAQAILLRINGYGEALGSLAERLYRVPMTNAEFIDLVTDIHPEPESKRGQTVWSQKVDLLGDLFSGGGDTTYTLDNVRGTAWAGLNAMTERIDWHRKTRGGDGSSLAIAAAGFTPNITQEKADITRRVIEWAEAKAPATMAG